MELDSYVINCVKLWLLTYNRMRDEKQTLVGDPQKLTNRESIPYGFVSNNSAAEQQLVINIYQWNCIKI